MFQTLRLICFIRMLLKTLFSQIWNLSTFSWDTIPMGLVKKNWSTFWFSVNSCEVQYPKKHSANKWWKWEHNLQSLWMIRNRILLTKKNMIPSKICLQNYLQRIFMKTFKNQFGNLQFTLGPKWLGINSGGPLLLRNLTGDSVLFTYISYSCPSTMKIVNGCFS